MEHIFQFQDLIWLIPLGFGVGTFGTLIGAGGGFILVPVLLLMYPDKRPDTITSMSLAVVFFNAFSGTLAYSRMKRVDFKSGWMFAVATVPGAILGAITTSFMPRKLFDAIFGVLMLAAALFLIIHPHEKEEFMGEQKPKYHMIRVFADRSGEQYAYSYNPWIGIILSLFVGYISSLLGIGGGIIHVPALVHLLNFPVHVATATSHFVLSIMALAGTGVHLYNGVLQKGMSETIGLAIGVVLGAQVGAKLSSRIHGNWIIRSLAIALGIVGVRILMMSFA